MEKEKRAIVYNGRTLPPPAAPSPKSPAAHSFPTTFIHADTSSFKRVVQMLTGSADTAAKSAAAPPPPAKVPLNGPKKPAFKLYERRHSSVKNLKMIAAPLVPALLTAASPFSPPRKQHQRQPPEISSPRVLSSPTLALSPVTPLIPDPFDRRRQRNSSSVAAPSMSDEDQAIAEKGFYLHPSPGVPEPPRLLPLFPVTSPYLLDA